MNNFKRFSIQFLVLVTILALTIPVLCVQPVGTTLPRKNLDKYEGLKKFNDLSEILKNKEGLTNIPITSKDKSILAQQHKENLQIKEFEKVHRPVLDAYPVFLEVDDDDEEPQIVPMSPCAHDKLYEPFLLEPEEGVPDFLFLHATEPHTGNFYSRVLSLHPSIEAPRVKEPNFFSFPWISKVTSKLYQSLYPNRHFDRDRDVLMGDFSSTYLFHALAAKRIAEQIPDIKIIMVLQDPVTRAHNAYIDRYNKGLESTSFERIIAKEIQDIPKFRESFRTCFNEDSCNRTLCIPTGTVHSHDNSSPNINLKSEVDLKDYMITSYLFRSVYDDMVERWIALFPIENFLFLTEDEFMADKVRTMKTIEKFLGIPSHNFPEKDLEIENQIEEEEEEEREIEELVVEPIRSDTVSHLCLFFRKYLTRLSRLTQKSFNWCR